MKKITSLTAMISFLVLIVNSVVLYIVPHGRVARWADWRLWGLSREQWEAQHTIIGLLFLVAIFFHTYYNWKPLVAYLKNKARQFRLFTKEFNIALLITFIFTVGSYFPVAPFSWVLDLSATIKDGAAVKYGDPPYGQAENSTLKDFTRRMGFDLAESEQRLKNAGIRFESEEQTLKEIAGMNGISPQQLYLAMKPPPDEAHRISPQSETPPADEKSETPSGLGSKTVAGVCEAYGINVADALNTLAEKGIVANPDDKMKALAEKYGKTPSELHEMMK
jgi:hypothetical protein